MRLHPVLFVFAISLCSAPLVAQNAATPVGAEAKALLQKAALTHGLEAEPAKPWHITFSLHVRDDRGGFQDQGIYEEYWAGPKKYKRIYSNNHFRFLEWGTEKGVFTEGEPNGVMELMNAVRLRLTHPLPATEQIAREEYRLQEVTEEGKRFRCVKSLAPPSGRDFVYCFSGNNNSFELFISQSEDLKVFANELSLFEERETPHALRFVLHGTERMEAHVEQLEPLAGIEDKFFAPSADAEFRRAWK